MASNVEQFKRDRTFQERDARLRRAMADHEVELSNEIAFRRAYQSTAASFGILRGERIYDHGTWKQAESWVPVEEAADEGYGADY